MVGSGPADGGILQQLLFEGAEFESARGYSSFYSAAAKNKTMRLLVAVGMLIVFISAIFILFIFDVMVRGQISCLYEQGLTKCNVAEMSFGFIIGLVIIAVFVLIDIAALYLIFDSLFKPVERPYFM